jgi:spore germination protein GerM
MNKQQSNQKPSIAKIAGISVVVLLIAGGGTACKSTDPETTSTKITSSPTPTTETYQAPQATTPTNKQEGQEIDIYWLATNGNEIEVAPNSITVAAAEQPDAMLKSAFQNLLAGPKDSDKHTSTIPEGTKLNSLEVRSNGIFVNLSEDFTSGGGTASMTARLGQIIYTASSLDPNAKIWISVEGEPLEVLGGEGLIVDQPMTRRDFEQNFSL